MNASTFRLLRALYLLLRAILVLGPAGIAFLGAYLDAGGWAMLVVNWLRYLVR